MALTALVEVATGRFITDGRAADGVAYVRVPVLRNPDDRRERYSGDPQNPFRAATAQELSDQATAVVDRAASLVVDDRSLKALLATALWFALGHQPTAQELQTAKTRYINIYKALG